MSLREAATAEARWSVIQKVATKVTKADKDIILDSATSVHEQKGVFNKNVENFVGSIKIPLGVAGPMSVNGRQHLVPIATTEAALVASISRGIKILNESGGVKSFMVMRGVQRVPVFQFDSAGKSIEFAKWATGSLSKFKELTKTITSHGELLKVEVTVEGNRAHVRLDFATGDASGQNIATFAAKKIVDYVRTNSPIPLVNSALEGGTSSDKKASAGVLATVRGRRMVAEAVLPKALVERVLHTTPANLVAQRQLFQNGHLSIGQIGTMSGNVANVLAAMYMALGQDPACVAEGHPGIARFELTPQGDVYCCITMPGIMIATVGGGTQLPSQKAAMNITGVENADQLAELLVAVCLAGELSITASFSADDFAQAHYSLARTATAKL